MKYAYEVTSSRSASTGNGSLTLYSLSLTTEGPALARHGGGNLWCAMLTAFSALKLNPLRIAETSEHSDISFRNEAMHPSETSLSSLIAPLS